jgi:hypothetical protein
VRLQFGAATSCIRQRRARIAQLIEGARAAVGQIQPHQLDADFDGYRLSPLGECPIVCGHRRAYGQPVVDNRSVLFVTLDSCRYDTFEQVRPRHLSGIGPLYRAKAPSYYTYGSHAAMFVGFTPGVFDLREPYVNPKYGRIFKMVGGGFSGLAQPWVVLHGRNIVEGFKKLGYRTIGSGGVGWFDPSLPTAQVLVADFNDFYYHGSPYSVRSQVEHVISEIEKLRGRKPVFCFLNVAETHVPYYHEGAAWAADVNPCQPFSEDNDAAECRRRQSACLEHVDLQLAPLLNAFQDANIFVCADHGDAWGEDGLWEHGIHHEKVLEVPLLMRLQHPPAAA